MEEIELQADDENDEGDPDPGDSDGEMSKMSNGNGQYVEIVSSTIKDKPHSHSGMNNHCSKPENEVGLTLTEGSAIANSNANLNGESVNVKVDQVLKAPADHQQDHQQSIFKIEEVLPSEIIRSNSMILMNDDGNGHENHIIEIRDQGVQCDEDPLKIQIHILENKIDQLCREKNDLTKKNLDIETKNKSTISSIKALHDSEILRLKKIAEAAEKAKESIVMRYVNSEKEVLQQKKERDNVEKVIKGHLKEIETLTKKNTMLGSEKNRLTNMIASLQAELNTIESLKQQIAKEQEAKESLEKEIDQMKRANEDIQGDMALCSGKEAELLLYTQQVTEKNVTLQSELSSVKSKYEVTREENDQLQLKIAELMKDIKGYEKILSQEKKGYNQEMLALEMNLEKYTKKVTDLQEELDEAKGEVIVLKKKHATSLRELNRELLVMKNRTEKSGATSPNEKSGEEISQSSRTSSSSSLNITVDSSAHKQKSLELLQLQSERQDDIPNIPDQQELVEKIVKLQRILAKKHEKIEFLQEHSKQLMDACQRKTKIIQTYAMCQDSGALSTEISDKNKAEVVKHGGIMASLYSSAPADDGLTLDLSLEINRKLQAVLEDTLLKNITLKENINTLGKEISNLTDINRGKMAQRES